MSRLTATQDSYVESQIYRSETLIEIGSTYYTTGPNTITATTSTGTHSFTPNNSIINIDAIGDSDFFSYQKSALVFKSTKANIPTFALGTTVKIFKLFVSLNTGLAATTAIETFTGKIQNISYNFGLDGSTVQVELAGEILAQTKFGVPNAADINLGAA